MEDESRGVSVGSGIGKGVCVLKDQTRGIPGGVSAESDE